MSAAAVDLAPGAGSSGAPGSAQPSKALGSTTSPLLDALLQVSSLDASVRVSATATIIHFLKGAQKHFEETALKHAAALIPGVARPCCHDLDYVLKRLTRGLASSNAAARQGFSSALVELLRVFDFVQSVDVLGAVLKATGLSARAARDEVRDAMLGRIFGFLVLQRAGRIPSLAGMDLASNLVGKGFFSFSRSLGSSSGAGGRDGDDSGSDNGSEQQEHDADEDGAGASSSGSRYQPTTVLGFMVSELVSIAGKKVWAFDVALEAAAVIANAAGPEAWAEDIEAVMDGAIPSDPSSWSAEQLNLVLALEESLVEWGLCPPPEGASTTSTSSSEQPHELAAAQLPSYILELRKGLNRSFLQRFVLMSGDEDGSAGDEQLQAIAEAQAGTAGNNSSSKQKDSSADDKKKSGKKMDVDGSDSDSDDDSDDDESLPSRNSDDEDEEDALDEDERPLPVSSAPFANAILGSTKAYPRLHSVWGRLLQRYATSALAPLPKAGSGADDATKAGRAAAVSAPPSEAVLEFAEVWRVYVDCLLMAQGPERKAAAMALLTSVLPHAADAHPAVIDAVLSFHLIRSMVRNLAQKSRMLHAPARAVIGTLLIACKGKSDISSVALVALVAKGHPDFDKRTATRAVAGLLSNLDEEAVLRHIAGAQREFVKPSAAPLYSDIASAASGLTGRSNAIKDGGDAASVRSGRSGRSAMTNTDPDVKAAEGEDDDADLALEKPRTLSPVESRRLWALDTITASLRNDGLRVLRRGPVMKAILSFLGLHAFADVGASEEVMAEFEKAGVAVPAFSASSSASSSSSSDGSSNSSKKSKRKSSVGGEDSKKKPESPTIAALRALASHVTPPYVAAKQQEQQQGGDASVAVDPVEASPLLVADPPLSVYMRSELRLRLVALVRHVTIAESVLASKAHHGHHGKDGKKEDSAASLASAVGSGVLPDGTSVAGITDNNSRGALELYSLGSLLNRVWDDVQKVQGAFLSSSSPSSASADQQAEAAAEENVQLSLFPSVELVRKAEEVAESNGMAGLDDDSSSDDDDEEADPVKARERGLKLAAVLHSTGLALLKAVPGLRGAHGAPASSSAGAPGGDSSNNSGGKKGKGHDGASSAAATVLETARFCLNYAALLQQVAAHMLLEGGRGLGLEHASALPGLGLAVGQAPVKAAKEGSDSDDEDSDDDDDEDDDGMLGAPAGAAGSHINRSDAMATAANCANIIASSASALDDMTQGCYHLLARSLKAASSALTAAPSSSASAPTPKSSKKDKGGKSAANTPSAAVSDGASSGSVPSAPSAAAVAADKAVSDALASLVAFAPKGTDASGVVSVEDAEKACVIFTDAALSLLASSTSTLRQAIKNAGGRFVFGYYVTVEAVESLLAVIGRSAVVNAKKEEEEDDDDDDDEEDSEDDDEDDDKKGKKSESAAKRQKKDSSDDDDDEGSSDSDDSGFSVSDEEDAKKKDGKQKKGSDDDDESSSDSDSDGGDFGFSEMEKYDRMLGEMIKARAKAKTDVKKQKQAETHFKQRALDLLSTIVARLKNPKAATNAVFASKSTASDSSSSHHADPRLLLLPAPMLRTMRILAARSRARLNASNVKGGDEKAAAAETAAFEAQELLSKLQELLQETLTARLPAQVDAASQKPLLSLFKEAIEAVQTAPTTEFVSACASACGVVLKALRPTPTRAKLLLTKEALADEKRRNAAQAACVQQPSVEHMDALAQGYASALATMLTEPHTRVGPSFFKNIFASMPALGVRLLPPIATVITTDAVSKPFRRAESLLSIGTIVKASSSGWSRDVPCATIAGSSSSAAEPASSSKKHKDGSKKSSSSAPAASGDDVRPEELLTVLAYLRNVLPAVLNAIAHEVDRAAKGNPAAADATVKPLGPKPLKEAIGTVTMLQKAKLACLPESEQGMQDGDLAAASERLYAAVASLLVASTTFPEHLRTACAGVLERAGREVPSASSAADAVSSAEEAAGAPGDDAESSSKQKKDKKKDKASGEKRKHSEAFDGEKEEGAKKEEKEGKKKDKKKDKQ